MADNDLHGLLERAAQQHGVFNAAQAAHYGLERRALHRAADRGWLAAIDGLAAVYLVRGSPPSWRQRAAALTLARPGAVLTHEAAGHLHGIEVEPPGIDLNLPRGAVAIPGVRCRWRHLSPEDRAVRDGIACTGIERTILDLWRARPTLAERDELLSAALAAGVDLHRLHGGATRLGSYRGSAARSLRFAVQRRSQADRSHADWVEQFCAAWAELRLPEPERVRRLTDTDGRLLAGASVLLRELRVIVERGGAAPGQERLLAARDVRLLGRGWLVARFEERHSPHAAAVALAEVARRAGRTSVFAGAA